MKKIILSITLIFFIIFSFSTPYFENGIKEVFYKEDYGDQISNSKLEIIKTSPYEIKWKSVNDTTTIETDKNLNTIKMIFKSENKNLQLIRKDRIIELTGTFEGKEIKKELVIDDDPWYQLFVFSFTEFIFSEDDSRYYWVFNPFDLSMNKMKVNKERREKINLNGKIYDTYLLNTRLTGFMSAFWKGEYWFDSKNGMYLKYDGLNIFPKIQNVTITVESWR
jgi:hypothetical protein